MHFFSLSAGFWRLPQEPGIAYFRQPLDQLSNPYIFCQITKIWGMISHDISNFNRAEMDKDFQREIFQAI